MPPAWGAAVEQLAAQAQGPQYPTLSLHTLDLDLCPNAGDNVLVSFSNKDSRDFTCKVGILAHAALTNIQQFGGPWADLPCPACIWPEATSDKHCVCMLAGDKHWLEPGLHGLREAGAGSTCLCRTRAPHEGPAHQGRPSVLRRLPD